MIKGGIARARYMQNINPSYTGSMTEETTVMPALDFDPANGTLQTKILTDNVTFTESLTDGQSMTLLLIDGASWTVTWPTLTWVTSTGNVAPTLTAADMVMLFKEGTTLYAVYSGSYA